MEIWAKNQITLLDIGGDFIGQVRENDDGYVGHPDIGNIDIGGDFIGSGAMTINSLDALTIEGDFDANVTLSSVMASSATLYDIGGEFSSSSFTLPTDGLVGQVIINSGDNSDVWDGDVVVGTATLAADYTELSSSHGGGQIGEAPFNFHQRTSGPGSESRDCDPYHTEVLTAPIVAGKNVVIPEVRIRHYGPVFADGTDKHYVIEFKSDALPSNWVNRTTLFEINTTATATSAGTAHRDVVVKKTALNSTGFTASGWWRIRPNDAVGEGRIKCGDVDGNPEVEYVTSAMVDGYYWFNFRVRLEGPGGSLLMTGGTSSSDLTSWIASPFEVNADGETDTQDFTELVEDYTSN